MTEVYRIRNDSGGSQELKDFGLIIPDTNEEELGDFQKAILSTELQALIQSDDVVRIVSGIDIQKANALLHNVLFFATRAGDEDHDLSTFQDELTLSIPGASDDALRIHFSIEFENDSQNQLTELQLIVNAVVKASNKVSFSNVDKGEPRTFSGYIDYQFAGAEDIILQTKVGGGTITTRNVKLSVEAR